MMDNLSRIKDAATPGPWEARSEAPHDVLTAWEENDPYPRGKLVICEHAGVDAALIAAAPEMATLLIECAEALNEMATRFNIDFAYQQGNTAWILLTRLAEFDAGLTAGGTSDT